MRPVTLPCEAPASHGAVLALAETAIASGLDGMSRVVVARDPRDANGAWRPACGRLDLARPSDPSLRICRPRGPARVLDECLEGLNLLERLRRAMNGEPFQVCGETFAEHGMESAWRVYHETSNWRDYGTTWPCLVASPNTPIPQRVYLHEVIEDDGPQGAHDGLEGLVRYATGFQTTRSTGNDIRFSRFQLVIWDYRGRIDRMAVGRNTARVEVSPKDDAAVKLVGLVSGKRTRNRSP